jgi:hypothetical protein
MPSSSPARTVMAVGKSRTPAAVAGSERLPPTAVNCDPTGRRTRRGEALALSWRNVRERTILVDRAVSLGKQRGTKTNATRTVRLLAPLAEDLAAWRSASPPGADTALVFPRPDGLPWRDDDYRNWRKRGYNAAAIAAGLESTRPYDLRHSFVSLLIHEGVSIVEVARQAGHSPEECLRTYAHTFEEFDPAERIPAETAIAQAREQRLGPNVRVLYVRAAEATREEPGFGSTEPSRRRDSNPRPPLYESGNVGYSSLRQSVRVL